MNEIDKLIELNTLKQNIASYLKRYKYKKKESDKNKLVFRDEYFTAVLIENGKLWMQDESVYAQFDIEDKDRVGIDLFILNFFVNRTPKNKRKNKIKDLKEYKEILCILLDDTTLQFIKYISSDLKFEEDFFIVPNTDNGKKLWKILYDIPSSTSYPIQEGIDNEEICFEINDIFYNFKLMN